MSLTSDSIHDSPSRRWISTAVEDTPYFDARNSTISTPRPMRISSAGTITERFSAGAAAVLVVGAGADSVDAGAAVVVALSVMAGDGTSSATGGAEASALVWEEGADAGGAVGAGSAGAGEEAATEGSGEELGAAIAGAAGLLDFLVFAGCEVVCRGVGDERRDADFVGADFVDVDADFVDVGFDDDVVRRVTRGLSVIVSARAVRVGGVDTPRMPRRCRRSAATRATKSRDSAAG